ncbi:antibiotic ABC transporter ATP-binding protein [Acidobacteria bacterium Mor1]|nr:antibiotic ABC transporter ATP-binding protein [Acidobacteria bacterium Mor1]
MRGGTSATLHEEESLGKAYDARLIRRIWPYLRPYRGQVFLALLILVLVAAAQLAQPYLIKIAIDEHITPGQLEGLAAVAGMFFIALLAEFLLRYAQFYVMERTGQNVVYDIRTAVFGHLQRLPAKFFDKNPVGRLMTRVTSDVEALNEAFTSGLVMILADLVKLVGIVAILLWMDWRMALITFAILPVMLVVTWQFRSRVRSAYRRVRGVVAKLNAFLQESVSGMRLVQLFGREKANAELFEGVNGEHLGAQLKGVRYDSSFSAVAEMIGSITLAAIVWAGGGRILQGSITFGTLVAFIDYAEKFFRPVQELSQRYTTMQAAMASAERLFKLLDTEPTIVTPDSPKSLPRPMRGRVGFDGVTFGYDPEQPVLHDVSFAIEPGQKIGVVGWTGSGKSTLIRLLTRLYDIQQGSITLDGVDVRELDLEELRRSVGVVLQDHFLFAGTLEYNVSLGDPRITPERVREAARAVRADRFVERLPKGWDEEVRERGSNFSMGERQLLSFARALAFDPAVLVLDEATASVDPETEHHIQEALETLMQGRTSIVIAHRLSTIRDADRILVLHQGQLVESGTHDELVEVQGGIYRTLHRLQTASVA